MTKKTILLLAVISIVLALTLFFIFYNSSLSGKESNLMSGKIVDIIRPLIDPNGDLSTGELQTIVRKTAHFLEFFLCGTCLALISAIISRKAVSPWIFMPLFITLLTAVADEYLQRFTGRTSLVTDVLIDFSGGLCGILIVTLAYAIILAIKKIIKKRHRTGIRFR